jgi:hypothetical protein
MTKARQEAWKKFGTNLLKFSAPVFAIFFGQLAMGVEWKPAALVAIYAFYGIAADYFKKLG